MCSTTVLEMVPSKLSSGGRESSSVALQEASLWNGVLREGDESAVSVDAGHVGVRVPPGQRFSQRAGAAADLHRRERPSSPKSG